MNLLNERTTAVMQAVFPLIAGLGLGLLFHAPYQIFTRALKPHELATGTSAFFLVRFTGATVGLAVAGAIFYGRASSRLPATVSLQNWHSSIDFSHLNSIEPLTLRREVLHVVSSSIQTIWTVSAPCLGAALVISVLLRKLPIHDTGDLTCSQEKLSTQSPADLQTAPAVV